MKAVRLTIAAAKRSPSGHTFLPQPFSNGLVTVMVPQLRRENSLLLWNVSDLNTPVHTFVGHDDVVLEFQWRRQKEGESRPAAAVSLRAVLLQMPLGCGGFRSPPHCCIALSSP